MFVIFIIYQGIYKKVKDFIFGPFALHNELNFISGGAANGYPTRAIFKLDALDNSWIKINKLNSPRSNHHIIQVIYFFFFRNQDNGPAQNMHHLNVYEI